MYENVVIVGPIVGYRRCPFGLQGAHPGRGGCISAETLPLSHNVVFCCLVSAPAGMWQSIRRVILTLHAPRGHWSSCNDWNRPNLRGLLRVLGRALGTLDDLGRKVAVTATIAFADDNAVQQHQSTAHMDGLSLGNDGLDRPGAKIATMWLVLAHCYCSDSS